MYRKLLTVRIRIPAIGCSIDVCFGTKANLGKRSSDLLFAYFFKSARQPYTEGHWPTSVIEDDTMGVDH